MSWLCLIPILFVVLTAVYRPEADEANKVEHDFHDGDEE